MSLFRLRRERIAESVRQAEKSMRIHRMLDRQESEVQHLSAVARNEREMNHLTELFMAGRGR